MNFELKTAFNIKSRNFVRKVFNVLLISILASLFFQSCSTEKNAFLNRNYHYVTVRYNGYFNGNEAYKLAKKNIAENHDDDFDELLDVYQYGSEVDNKNEYANLDRAIKKGAKMIDRHSMPFKIKGEEVEVNQMIDDCYLLIGKARFLKYDFESAKETFLYIQNNFQKGQERYKASLWLVLTYIYQENFVDAETTIKALKEDKEFPEKFKNRLKLVEAISFKRSGQFDKAIPAFEAAIENIKNKKFRRRVQFILAQLYEQKGDKSKAAELYKYIAKKATNYDLQFNAKINLATTYEGSGSEVINILEKMLKDEKNKEYRDQIYFALAKVYEKQGNDVMAVKNYKLSAQTSVKNKKQKGKAFLALGNYYFKKPDYINAANYYDSTLLAVNKSFPGYEEISEKKESLKDLVKHLKTVQEQDSLLKIANMPELEREQFIQQKITYAKENAEKLEAKRIAAQEKAIADAAIQGNSGATWVFENPGLLASGLAEFRGLWGDRPLEDNWRRSDKTSIAIDQVNNETEETDVYEEKIPENQTTDYYLKDLPLGVDQQEVANQKIKDAYYQLGVLYRDNFNDLPTSIYYFNQLNTRYPKNTKEAVTWYQLYRNYDKINDEPKREDVKQKVISNYPNSEYAQLLLNPNMLADQEQQEAKQELVYEQIFGLYQREQYKEVVQKIASSNTASQGSEIAGKFGLLNAFAKGGLYSKDSLEFYLRKTYQDNMGTEAANDADLLLGQFRRENALVNQAKKDSVEKDRAFLISEGEPHYFVMIYSNETNKTDVVLAKVSNFNQEYYSNKSLKAKSIAWNDKEDVIVVKPFKDFKDTGNYFQTIEEKLIDENKGLGDFHFMISISNYKKLFQYKEMLRYVDFYKKHYTPRK